jgi:hypothetical protein
MSDGPTTAGSIVGKLRLDKDQWNRDKAEAKADAAELGALEPTIKVDAKVGDALAKLEAVRLAQEKLGFASDNLKLAYQRLDEVQTKGGASQSRLMALHLAAARAESAHAAATKGLAAAQASYSANSDRAAISVDRVDESNKRAAASSSLNLNRTTMLVGAIAALIPLLAPLAGYAVGVAGALAGMGAAGLLAILGIKNAMDSGTAAGNQFAGGLQSLNGNLDQLAGTAASNMLTAFRAAVEAIDSAMPQLNSQIGLFAKQLGTTGNIVLNGVLTAFRVLNPLFLQAGVYVEQLAVGFQKWTSDGGLQEFTQMAVAALPQVAGALGDLAKGALDVVGALAPLGSILLTLVGGIGQLLSAIAPLLANLTPLGLAVGAVAGAFALWSKVGPIVESVSVAIRGFGVDLTVMLGAAGIAIAVIGYLASAMITQRMAASAAAQALQDYTAAVQQDNGVIGESVKAQTAKWAANSQGLGNYTTMGKSAINVGRELGLTAQTITNAALGQRDALKQVSGAMQNYANDSGNSTAKVAALRAEFNNLVGGLIDNQKHIADHIKAYNDLADAQGLVHISTSAQLKAQTELAASYGMSLPQYMAVVGAQKQTADQAAATTRQLQMENDAATLLGNAFAILDGGTLGVAQAQTGAAAAANSLFEALKTNGLEIDGNTKAAVANQQAIQQKVLADQQSAEAIAKQTGSTKAGTDAFGASKVALMQQLAAQGLLTPAIQAYIDKLYAIPAVKPTKIDLDAAAAIQRAQDLKSWIDSINSKTVVITMQTNATGMPQNSGTTGKVYKNAEGGTVGGSGGPKADTVLSWLSTGEEVIPNPQAGRYRSAFKALSADNVPAARAALGGKSGTTVVHNHVWQLPQNTDVSALHQSFAMRDSSLGAA